MAPNILWIVFDTARADACEPYGAPTGATPVLADLARRGEALRDVRSTACWTLPAHVSMFAGALPRKLGFADPAGLTPHSARPIIESLEDRLLPAVLRRAGYSTAAVSANAWISRHSGFATGFDRFVDTIAVRQAKMAAPGPWQHARWLWEAARAKVDDGARDAGRRMRGWIDEGADRPFFWFVNLVECHSPYLPPKPYAGLPLTGRVRAAREATTMLTQGAFWRTCVTGDTPPEDALQRMRAGYRGAIRYMDDWLGGLLESLDAAGLLDDTLVIVSSDHGENFGESGLIGHGFSLDERLINVPFVAAGPGADRLRDVGSFVELPARLAELAGLADHPYDPADLPPLPVAQFDSPAPSRDDPRTGYAIELWDLDEEAAERLTMPLLAVVDGWAKMVVRGSAETFYDLRTDPLEERPLPAGRLDPDVVARLREAADHPSVRAQYSALASSSAEAATPSDDELTDLEDRMRLLGYL